MITWSLNDTTGRLSAKNAASIIAAIDLLAAANARWGMLPTVGTLSRSDVDVDVAISLVHPGMTTSDPNDIEVPFHDDSPIFESDNTLESIATSISRALWTAIAKSGHAPLSGPVHNSVSRVPVDRRRGIRCELADPRNIIREEAPVEPEPEPEPTPHMEELSDDAFRQLVGNGEVAEEAKPEAT